MTAPGQNPFSLHGRCALVTGASRGIGRALAGGLAAAGAEVIASGRNRADLEGVATDIEHAGGRCHRLLLDVRDLHAIDHAFAEIDAAGWRPDILINNAGVEQVCPSTDVDEALWDRIGDTNLKGAFFVCQRFARGLLDRSASGAVVNVCSLTSGVGVPTAVAYTASKSGLLGMTRALSAEWAAHGIRVNAIGPGYFRTALTEVFYRDGEWREAMLGKIPGGRFGELDDLVGPTVFLCSQAAAYVTGQLLYVDGGYMASI